MYLIDTNIISEARKGARANRGVRRFFADVIATDRPAYLSVVTIGELQRGIALVRRRGDLAQAEELDGWLNHVLSHYADAILPVDSEIARLWGYLRAPHPENALDKLIAASALLYDLTVVTRNASDFAPTGARVWNPFR